MNDELARGSGWSLHPEGAEERELLAARLRHVDGKATGGQAISLAPRYATEIAGALKDEHLVEDVRAIDWRVDAQTGEADRRRIGLGLSDQRTELVEGIIGP